MYKPSKNSIRLRHLQAQFEIEKENGNELKAAQLNSDIIHLCDKMDAV